MVIIPDITFRICKFGLFEATFQFDSHSQVLATAFGAFPSLITVTGTHATSFSAVTGIEPMGPGFHLKAVDSLK